MLGRCITNWARVESLREDVNKKKAWVEGWDKIDIPAGLVVRKGRFNKSGKPATAGESRPLTDSTVRLEVWNIGRSPSSSVPPNSPPASAEVACLAKEAIRL